MPWKSLWTVCVLLAAGPFPAGAGDYGADRELYESTCMTCHSMDPLLWPRSYKSWQLTVARMQTYTFEGQGFTDEEGERIARFLSVYAGDGVLLDENKLPPDAEDAAESATVAESPPGETVPDESAVAEPVEEGAQTDKAGVVEAVKPAEPVVAAPPAVPASPVPPRRFWNPSRTALLGARMSGFAAVLCLIGLLITGFMSRTLRGGLRRAHAILALGLFLSLATHGLIHIVEYGTPNVLWYWFGLVGFVAMVVTQFQGIFRKRFRKGLLAWHATGACFGLALSILHWIWAWL